MTNSSSVLILLFLVFSIDLEGQIRFNYDWNLNPTEFIKSNRKELFSHKEYSELIERDEIAFVVIVKTQTREILSVEYSIYESQLQILEYGTDLAPELTEKVVSILKKNIILVGLDATDLEEDKVRLLIRLLFDKKDRKRNKSW